jgi:hypothetical protein
MNQQDTGKALLRFPGEQREFAVARPTTYEYAILEELSFVRREAQREANAAYEDWQLRPGDDAYIVYRAAADRADAAQDQLAHWAAHVGR